ncbi:MAG: SpoIVB peptidase [Alicyclobacillaceae bacterium]|nr:SpoIVB peptidase [Alicyclobacillaceae bacterium]
MCRWLKKWAYLVALSSSVGIGSSLWASSLHGLAVPMHGHGQETNAALPVQYSSEWLPHHVDDSASSTHHPLLGVQSMSWESMFSSGWLTHFIASGNRHVHPADAAPRRYVHIGGQSVGIRLQADGAMVVGFQSLGDVPSPAKSSSIRIGDMIVGINGHKIHSAADLALRVAHATHAVQIQVDSLGREKMLTVRPKLDDHGISHLGLYVRDRASGVGTLTYFNPTTHRFGALGHVVTDLDTGQPIHGRGFVYPAHIVSIIRGQSGEPGEKRGQFSSRGRPMGDIDSNNDFGVFGNDDVDRETGPLMPVAKPSEVHVGPAIVFTVLHQQRVESFRVNIERLGDIRRIEPKSFVIRVADARLLKQAGGIVQGMSGSPIVQDGRLVGAVTHVFVSDPTRGYGVFAEWMLATDKSHPGMRLEHRTAHVHR